MAVDQCPEVKAARPWRIKMQERPLQTGSVLFLSGEIPECTADAQVESQLFKSAAASSSAWVCERKRLGVANNSNKVTPWWN